MAEVLSAECAGSVRGAAILRVLPLPWFFRDIGTFGLIFMRNHSPDLRGIQTTRLLVW